VAKIHRQEDGDIIDADLYCTKCDQLYSVKKGVAVLLPGPLRARFKAISKYETDILLSCYLWAHYGDFIPEKGASEAYRVWAGLIAPTPGLGIDAGCAVGRFSFEMSSKCDLVVGVDASEAFIRTARAIMLNRKVDARFPIEGHINRREVIELPDSYDPDNVEFIVADVEAIPFASAAAKVFVSLNVIDKIAHPLAHVLEMNRVVAGNGAQCLFSDPFSWSDEVAEAAQWLGGKDSGPFSGRGLDNLKGLLKGEKGPMMPPWEIESIGNVWWKIRNHENHYELIRSWYIKATR